VNTCSLDEAKSDLGALADKAIQGHPTVIERDGKFVILQAYDISDYDEEFDRLIQEGKDSGSRPFTPEVWDDIRRKGQALAAKRR
jgi:hypothetical protein